MAPLSLSHSSVCQLVSRVVVVIADVFPINHVLPPSPSAASLSRLWFLSGPVIIDNSLSFAVFRLSPLSFLIPSLTLLQPYLPSNSVIPTLFYLHAIYNKSCV